MGRYCIVVFRSLQTLWYKVVLFPYLHLVIKCTTNTDFKHITYIIKERPKCGCCIISEHFRSVVQAKMQRTHELMNLCRKGV